MWLLAVIVAGLLAGPSLAAADVPVWFGQGEQLTKVSRPGTTSEDAVRALLAGPTAAEVTAGVRTYVPAGTPLRSFTVSGDLATIDLSSAFVGGAQDGESQFARFAQLVKTATGLPGSASSPTTITRVQLLIDGGVPLGLIPGVRTALPVTLADIETPDTKPPVNPPGATGASTRTTRGLQQRLADLGYLGTSDVTGRSGPTTTNAVIAFQKWEGLARDGVAGSRTQSRLTTARRPAPLTSGPTGRRVEVLLDRQVALVIQGNRVVRTLHVSTGKASTPTRVGTFSVYQKIRQWWSVPFASWLMWALPFDGGIAFHEYSPVPVSAASHGCVRLPAGNAKWLYDSLPVGAQVKVIARSR